MNENVELKVCQTCLLAMANGADSMDLTETEIAAIAAGAEKWWEAGYHLIATDSGDHGGDGDYGFMWNTDCDVCGDSRGGDRHAAVAMPR